MQGGRQRGREVTCKVCWVGVERGDGHVKEGEQRNKWGAFQPRTRIQEVTASQVIEPQIGKAPNVKMTPLRVQDRPFALILVILPAGRDYYASLLN